MKTFSDFGIDLGGRSGVEVQTTCPQCSPIRTKSKARCLSVNTEKGIWVCHHCGWAGSLKQGEQHKTRFTVRPHYRPPDKLTPALIEFVESRGINTDIVQRQGVGLETVYMPQVEEEIAVVVFPYRRRGEVVNCKYRGLMQKVFRQVAHAEKILYNLDALDGQTEAVIVEGELDALSVMQAGISHVVSVPDGAPPAGSKSSEAKFEYLVNCEAQLTPMTKIILAVDNDPPGRTLEAELARRLGPERCWRVTWPHDCKDANDVLLLYGTEALADCIKQATPYPLDGVFTVADLAGDVVTLYQGGLRGGVSTGMRNVDRHYTVRPGELTIVTGIPAHGKSQLLDAMTVNLAREHGWQIAMCSPENVPVQRHLAKLIEQFTGYPFREGPSMRLPERLLAEAIEWLHQHFVFIVPEDTLTIPALIKTAKSLVARHGIRGLVIDPWNEFDHTRPNGHTETEYISTSLGHIRRFARHHGVHVWLVAHPQKLYRRDDGSYPVPTPYDISGSAHWRNKADNCLTVWREENEPDQPVRVYIQKVRFREVGTVGMVELRWDKINGRYEEWIPAPAHDWQEDI